VLFFVFFGLKSFAISIRAQCTRISRIHMWGLIMTFAFLYLSIYLSIYLSLSICVSREKYVDRSVSLSISLCLYLSISLSLSRRDMSIYLSVSIYLYLSLLIDHLSKYRSIIHLSLRLSIYRSHLLHSRFAFIHSSFE
jgi:hypothetical protein